MFKTTLEINRFCIDLPKILFNSEAVPFLTYTSGGETYQILDPQGYANKQLQNIATGKDLFFKDTIKTFTTEDLKNLLKKPNAKDIYTVQQLKFIEEEIDSRE